jgi:hypothetical protein
MRVLEVVNKVTRPLMLRRTKASHAKELKLQKLTTKDIYVTIGEKEKGVYRELLGRVSKQFGKVSDEVIRRNYVSFYEIIMKLRQVCDHYCVYKYSSTNLKAKLIEKQFNDFAERRHIERKKELAEADAENVPKNTRTQSGNVNEFILTIKNDEEGNICVVCRENMEEVIVTICRHYFCKSCIVSWLGNSQSCPVCRENISKNDLFALPK